MTSAAVRSMGTAALLLFGVADLALLNLKIFPRLLSRNGFGPGTFAPAPSVTHGPAAVDTERSAPERDVAPAVAPATVPPPPVPPREPGSDVIAVRRAFFARNQHLPQEASVKRIAALAKLARERQESWIFVDGHADQSGPPAYNDWLSVQRANAVAERLVAFGTDRARIVVRHFGASRPLASDDTATPLRRNRRVDLTLVLATPGAGDRHEH
jgi:outer membrane protein OmpA-like peptidoglycan-associated protein